MPQKVPNSQWFPTAGSQSSSPYHPPTMSPGPKPVSLILLPGLDGTGLLFQPLVAALPAAIQPRIVRYPGHRHLTYHELLPLVMDALPQSGPFILLGESFGGPLATMVAAERPPGLVGLILCASF